SFSGSTACSRSVRSSNRVFISAVTLEVSTTVPLSNDVSAGCAGGSKFTALAPKIVLEPIDTSALAGIASSAVGRSEEHTSELQSRFELVCRLLLEKKKQSYRSPLG